jgi:type I restriction enzyme, S subunit
MSNGSEWTTINFGDLVKGYRGVSYQPHNLLDGYTEDSVVLLRANNIQHGRLQFDDIQIVPKHLVKNTQYLSIGDVAVCMSNGSKHLVGKSAQLVDETNIYCTIGAFCSVFRPKAGSDPKFVKQLFLSDIYQAHIDLSLAGSAINNLKNSDIESIVFKVPSKPKQKKIAEILDTIDRTITHTEALIEKYQQIKAGLMHDLFTRGIGADGKLRPPHDQASELYQDSSIGWIPKEWDCSPLRTKSQPGVSHLKTGPFGSSLKGKHWVEHGIPVITIGALGEGKFNIAELLFINDFDAKRLDDFQMKFGDVVFSRVADVGRSVVINTEQIGWIMSSNLMRISLDRNLVNPNFLQYQLSYDFRLKNQIRCKVNSGGRDVANSEVLNSLFFVWPKIDEQLEIIKRAESISSRINAEDHKLQKLYAEKSGLMHDLLTGTVQVNSDPV